MSIKFSDLPNPTLARAVSRQVGGKSELLGIYADVLSHGADSGFSGFIYYYETIKFWKTNKKTIIESIQDLADDCGQGVLEMVSNFNCIKGDFSHEEIGKALYGNYSDDLDLIYNCLAWYALESVCSNLDNV
jgi:hypothetical protein